uniref:Glycosyltransferase n=1 Tax=Ginkgo biloba TaxID=3311 RepID=A0A2Z2PJY1_GINBI|nr:UDP-glycosyltransferase [Ginkgo biloba]
MAAEKRSQRAHMAIFPSEGMGHLIPFLEFSKRLALFHNFSITFITTATESHVSPAQAAYVQLLTSSSSHHIRFIQLPKAEEEEEQGISHIERVLKMMDRTKSLMEDVLKSLLGSSPPISAFITDMFRTHLLHISAKLHIPSYILFASNAALVSLMLHLPKLVSEIQVPFKELEFPVKVPGFPPIPPTDLPTPLQDRLDPHFDWFLSHSAGLREANGILINTFEELESQSIKALVEGKVLTATHMPSIYPIGPLISSPMLESDRVRFVEDDRAECLKWMDEQSVCSVVFVAFGSRARLSAAQIMELALGLEASGQRFLWALCGPLTPSSGSIPISQLLPEGFESRTKDRGLVVTSWAPQIPILAHPSTGGFLSHCGWNSTLESISHGIPMIAWPIAAEQRMNSFILVNDIKVAIEAKRGSEGIVRREEVERVVKSLMDGHEGVKKKTRIRELKDSAEKALAEGGSSYKAMANVAAVWKESATATV